MIWPLLGKYTVTVLSAYGVAIVLIAALVLATVIRGIRVRRALEETERRRKEGRAHG